MLLLSWLMIMKVVVYVNDFLSIAMRWFIMMGMGWISRIGRYAGSEQKHLGGVVARCKMALSWGAKWLGGLDKYPDLRIISSIICSIKEGNIPYSLNQKDESSFSRRHFGKNKFWEACQLLTSGSCRNGIKLSHLLEMRGWEPKKWKHCATWEYISKKYN